MTGLVRRPLAALASLVFATLGLAVVAAPAQAMNADPPPCVSAAAAKYKHTFVASDGASTATATIATYPAGTQLCGVESQQFSLVSYFAPSVAFNANQYVYDDDVQTMSGTTTSLSFSVQVPPCYTQVDFVFGPVITDLRLQLYGDKKVGSGGGPGNRSTGVKQQAWFNGYGSNNRACTNPSAMSVPKCDGSGTILLSNSGLSDLYPKTTFNVSFNGEPQAPVEVPRGGSKEVFPGLDGWPAVITEQGSNFTSTFDWAWPDTCEQPTRLVQADCDNLILRVTNPSSMAVNATATYNGQTQTELITKGNTEVFTFAAGTGAASIAFNGAPYWTSLTASFVAEEGCQELADTGMSVTTVIAVGSSLAAAGAFLIYFVARTMGRRRRTA